MFRAETLGGLRRACGELSCLLTWGYNPKSALELVGNRHALTKRQREAVARCACAEPARLSRTQRRRSLTGCEELWVDGFNVLLTLEAALSRAPVFIGRDDCLRDIASVHGTYRRVAETGQAIELLLATLSAAGVGRACILLDSPISSSGKLAGILREHLGAHGLGGYEVELCSDVDARLIRTPHRVATADAGILDRCAQWVNLAREVVGRHVAEARLFDLRRPAEVGAPAD